MLNTKPTRLAQESFKLVPMYQKLRNNSYVFLVLKGLAFPTHYPLTAHTCRSQCLAASTMARSSWKASTKGTKEVKRENSML